MGTLECPENEILKVKRERSVRVELFLKEMLEEVRKRNQRRVEMETLLWRKTSFY